MGRREIPLTQGLVALVDDEDYERVMAAGPWQLYIDRGPINYAVRTSSRRAKGPRKQIRLHAFLTGWPLIDHRNGDGLDNRRANLRPATTVENNRNRRIGRNNTSGFKGVGRQRSGRWRAYISLDSVRRDLGTYDTAEEAARAYDEAARRLHGEFACVNFPEPGERSARIEVAS